MTATSAVFPRRPIPLAQILSRARDNFTASRPLTLMGLLGIALGSICMIVFAVRGGAPIPPEGDLTKSGSFDVAVGIYLLTVALLLPVAHFSEKGRRRWMWWNVGLVAYAYSIETIQIFRGLDPRFSKVGTPVDQIVGLIFFLQALTLMVLFIIMAVSFFRRNRPDAQSPLLLAIRYGCVTALGAFAAGIWMSVIQGRVSGAAGNILPLHALGFHGLQTVPMVALLLDWAGADAGESRKWVHVTGVAWVVACAAVAYQTVAGRSIFDVSPAIMVSVFVLVIWSAGALLAFWRWARVPIPRESPDISRMPT